MTDILSRFLKNCDSRLNSAVVFLILLAAILGCGGKNPNAESTKKTIPAAYVGGWTAADGSTLTIRNDSTGDYKSGGASVNGAAVEVDEAAKQIRFTLLGFNSGKYKIDQPPKNNRMRLDNMEYRRSSGFAADGGGSGAAKASNLVDAPTAEEIRPIATATIRDFDKAVEAGDFTNFYQNVSEMWQSQTSAIELKEAFAAGLRKSEFRLKLDAPLVFSAKPALDDDDVLQVGGTFQNLKNGETRFRLRYIRENGDWKLLGIRINS